MSEFPLYMLQNPRKWQKQSGNLLMGHPVIIENEWNTTLAARCLHPPLVPGLHMWGWLSLQLQYPHFLGSGGRQPPAARVSILGPALLRSSDAGLSSWLLQTLRRRRHFQHSINHLYFISSIPSGALVVRKCIGTLVSCNLVEKMTAGSGLSTPHFSNISLDRFRIIWSPKPETSSPTLSSLWNETF